MAQKVVKITIAALASVAFAIALAIVVLPIVRNSIQKEVTKTLDSVGKLVRDMTGLDTSYSYISFSSINEIVVRDLKLYTNDTSSNDTSGQTQSEPATKREVISCGRIQIRLDLWAAILGKKQSIVRELNATALSLALRTPTDMSIFDKLKTYSAGQSKGPIPMLVANVDSASILVSDTRGVQAHLTMPAFQVSTLSGFLEVFLPSLDYMVKLPSLKAPVSGNLGLTLAASNDYSSWNGNLRISANYGEYSLHEQRVVVSVGNGEIVVKGGGGGIGYEGRYEMKGGGIRGDVKVEGYRPDGMVEVKGGGIVKELMGLVYTGEVKVTVKGGVVGYEGKVGVVGGDGQVVGGVDVGGMGVEGTFSGDGVGIGKVEVSGTTKEGISAGYSGGVVYEGMKVGGTWWVSKGGEVVRGEVKGSNGEGYEVKVGDGSIGGIGVRGVAIGVKDKGSRYDVSVVGEVRSEGVWGSVRGEGSVTKGSLGVEGGVEVKDLGVMGIVKEVEALGYRVGELGVKGMVVSGKGYVQGGGGKVSWSVNGVDVKVDVGGTEVRVRGDGVGNESGYEVKGVKVGIGKEEVSIGGKGTYGVGVSFVGNIGYKGMGYGVKVEYRGGVVSVSGDYGLEGKVWGEGGGYKGEVVVKGMPLAVGKGVVYGSVDATGSVVKGVWGVEVRGSDVRYEGEGNYPEVQVIGSVSGTGADLRSVAVRGQGYGLTGALTVGYGKAGGGVTIGGNVTGSGYLGDGTKYVIQGAYEGGKGRMSIGVGGYPLDVVGVKGYRATGYVSGSGDVDMKGIGAGDYRSLSTWVMEGSVGVDGPAYSLHEQRVVVSVGNGEIVVKGGGGGIGYEGRYEMKGGDVRGDVKVEGYRPEGMVEVKGGGIVKELMGLVYTGEVKVTVKGGVVGYEGKVGVVGGEGQVVGGVDVGGMGVEGTFSGDGVGIGKVEVSGTTKEGISAGYSGGVVYEGMKVGGAWWVSKGGEVVRGEVKGSTGEGYEVKVGDGSIGGIGVRGVAIGVKDKGSRYDVSVVGEVRSEGVWGSVRGEGSVMKGSLGVEGGVEVKDLGVMGIVKEVEALGYRVGELGVKGMVVSGKGYVQGGGGKVSWSVNGVDVKVDVGGTEVRVRGDVVGNESGYEVKGVKVGIGKEEVSIGGKGTYGGGVSFVGNIGYKGMGYGVKVEYRGGVVSVSGDYGLEGKVWGEGGGYKGEVVVKGMPLAVGKGVVYGSVDATGSVVKGVWGVEVRGSDVRYEGEGNYPEVQVIGSVSGTGADLRSVAVRGQGYGLTGALTVGYGKAGGGVTIGGNVTGSGYLGDGTKYVIQGAYEGGKGRMSIGVGGYPLDVVGVKGYRATGYVSGSGDVDMKGIGAGDYRSLSTWVMEGSVGVDGPAYSLHEQRVVVSVGNGEIVVKGGGGGIGYEGRYEMKGGDVRGDVKVEGYRPEGMVEVKGGGIVKELMGLVYTGEVKVTVKGGVVGYEGKVGVVGGEGQVVGGVDVGGMGVEGTFSGDGVGIGKVEVSGTTKEGISAGYSGGVVYEGMKVGGAWWVSKGGEVVRGEVKGSTGEGYEVKVGDGSIGGIGVRGVAIGVKDKGSRYDVSVVGEVRSEGVWGSVRGEGSVTKGSLGVEGGVEVKDLGVMGIVKEVEALGYRVGELGVKGMVVSGKGYVQGGGGKVSWSVNGVDVKVDVGGTEVRVRGDGVGNESGYEVKGVKVGIGKEEVSIGGKGTYGGGVSFVGNIGYKGMGYGVKVEYRGGVVSVSGDYGLVGKVWGEGGGYKGEVVVKGMPLAVGKGVVYGSVDATGSVVKGVWGVEVRGSDVRYEGEGNYPEVQVIGSVSGTGADLRSVAVRGQGYGLTGALTATYANLMSDPNIMLKGSFSNTDNAREKYDVSAIYSKGSIVGNINLAGFQIERLMIRNLKGDLEGTITVDGPFQLNKLDLTNLPPVNFDVRLANGEYNAIPLNFSMSGELQKSVATVKSAALSYMNHKVENIKSQFSLADGTGTLGFDYRGVFGSDILQLSEDSKFKIKEVAKAVATLTSTQSSPSTTTVVAMDSQNQSGNPTYEGEISGTLQNIKFHETLIKTWAFSGTYMGDTLQIAGGNGDMALSYAKDGKITLFLSDSLPVSGNLKGTLSSDGIDMNIEALKADLSKLSTLLPMGLMKITGGSLQGNMKIKGSPADPEFNGSISLQKVSLESADIVKGPIGPFDATLVAAGRSIQVSETTIPLQKGSISVSVSSSMDRWLPTNIKLNIASQKNSLVNLDGKIAGITVHNATARLDVVASIENDLVNLDGSIFLDNGEVYIDPQGFNVPSDQQSQTLSQPATFVRLKAQMSFGKQLQVFFPDKNVPIVSGFTDPSSNLLLQYDSATQDFTLDGKIILRTGYVMYYLRNFFLKSCEIDFAENTTKFNPLVSAIAELRESSSQGPIVITLTADKIPLENLHPRLTSVPFMSETQLIALMSGGVLPTDTNNSPLDIRSAVISSSEFIPQLNIFKSFEQKVQKALGLDIVYIRSTFLQRWLLDVTKPSTQPAPEDPLAYYLNQTELYFGKYLTDSAFLHASVRVREDPLVSASRLRLDSEFGIEFNSPFGLINWSITPALGTEGSFVTSQKLSLSWQFSY